jgi:hypothetical protein
MGEAAAKDSVMGDERIRDAFKEATVGEAP